MKTTTATPQTITAAAVVRAMAQSLTLAATYGAQRISSTEHDFTLTVVFW